MTTGLFILAAIAVAWAAVALYFIGRYGGVKKAVESLMQDNKYWQLAHREIADAYAGAGQRITEHETNLLNMSDQLRTEKHLRTEAEATLTKHAGLICQRPGCNRNIDEHNEYGKIERTPYTDIATCDGFTFKQSGLWAQQGN